MPRLDCITILEAGSFGSDSGTVVIPTGENPFPNHINVYPAVGTAAGTGTATGVAPSAAGTAAGIGAASAVGAIASTTSFRYWRVVTNYTTQNAAIIAEIQLRETAGGADATGSGTAGESGHSTTDVAANAVDNNAATHWWSDANLLTTTVYWSYDFGSGKDIVEIVIQAHSGSAGYTPRAFHIQGSDDNSTWTTVWGERSMATWTAGESRTFTRPAAGLPMYGNPGSIGNRTGSITITSTAVFAVGTVSTLIDGINTGANAWWNAGQSNREILFDFGVGASKTIDGFTWYQDVSSGNGTWVMEGSNDNSSYTTFPESFTLGTGVEHVVTLTNTTGYRYYRLRQTAGTTSNTQYIREIEFKIK